MGFLEQLGQFHAQAGQLVDVEETPVIDLFRSNTPIGDPVGLHFEQLVQARETQGVTRLTTELLQCNLDSAGEGRLGRAFGEPMFQLGRALPGASGRALVNRRKFAADARQRLTTGFEDLSIAAWRYRKTVLIIPRAEASLFAVEAKRDLAFLEDHAVVIA